jgi:hypothetical protein
MKIFTRMRTTVRVEVTFLGEGLATTINQTSKWFFARVGSLMASKFAWSNECLVASREYTCIEALTSVLASMRC